MKMQILEGDIFDRIKEIPDNSIDLCITSPPYWGLRNYGVDGQLGAEPTMELYLDHTIAWVKEIYRVLKPTGSIILNIGDCFFGGGMKEKCSDAIDKTRYECPSFKMPKNGFYRARQLLSVSSFAYCRIVSETDFVCRGEHIWAKPNVPSPIRSRLKHSHEKLFWFVKDANGYYFDEKPWEKSINQSSLARYKRNSITMKEYGDGQNNPYRAIYKAKMDGERPADLGWKDKTIEHSWRVVPVGEKQQGFEMENGKPASEHVAPFPSKLIEPYVISLCPEGGVVLDPFLGSGTTMRVAMENNRSSIGIELSSSSIAYAKKRLNWKMGINVEYEG